MKLSKYFTSPIFDDEEGRKTLTNLLKTFLLTAILLMPLIVFLRIADRHLIDIADLVLAGYFVLFLIYYYLAKKDRFFLSSILFFLIVWAGITVMAMDSAGIRDVTITGYILLIFLATLFNGYRFGFFIAVISLVSFWTMAIREHLNLFVPHSDPPLNYARDLSVIIILIVMAAIMINRSFKYSYQRVRKELDERKKAQEDLSRNEQKLISNNNELKESYEKIKMMNKDLLVAKDAAEKSDRLKTSFLQNISHEIRTPMNGIVGFAELLRSDDLSDEKRDEYSRLMTSCTYQLAAVVNDLIDISKIESGDIELIAEIFSINELQDSNFEIYTRAAAEKGIRVEISNEYGDMLIRSDRSKLSQVLINLMSNAVKFTSQGWININFSRREDNLHFSVSDTGIGIEKELLPEIFDRFRQAETGLDRSYSGAGLGLAISKGLIDFMGGTIEVESGTGKGSIFRVSVPVEFTEYHQGEKTQDRGIAYCSNLKILIADDDEISSIYLKEILSDFGNELHFAGNGNEAIDIIERSGNIDLVLMDLKMPGMSGYEAARIIKRSNPSIPIIAVSAFTPEEENKKARGGDIDEYIVKPVDRKILFSRIEKVLSSDKSGTNNGYR